MACGDNVLEIPPFGGKKFAHMTEKITACAVMISGIVLKAELLLPLVLVPLQFEFSFPLLEYAHLARIYLGVLRGSVMSYIDFQTCCLSDRFV
jgi:hypothetical protein